jgi:hypothetical protein
VLWDGSWAYQLSASQLFARGRRRSWKKTEEEGAAAATTTTTIAADGRRDGSEA